MLSKYSRIYSIANGVALYSTISGALVYVSQANVDQFEDGLSEQAKKKLKDLRLFFDSPQEEVCFVDNAYRRMRQAVNRCLYVTVEITTSCNFKCAFCYQNKGVQTRTMNASTVDSLLLFLERSDLSTYNAINVNFIGGEPLLLSERVKSIWNGIVKLARVRGLNYSAKVNTNGYCLTEDIVESFENAEFVVPLGGTSDYGSVIKLNADPLCDLRRIIKSRLSSLVAAFNCNKTIRIVLRYNVNHKNFSSVDEYFKEISSMGFRNYRIDVVNTNNAEFSEFRNEFADEEFWRWYLDIVLPLCAQYSMPEPIRFRNELSRCKARRRGSFKLFADGRIGICNGVDYSRTLPSLDDLKNVAGIDRYYADIKEYDYMLNDQCRCCDKIFICGGNAICHKRNCNIQENRLEEYVRKKVALMKLP